MNIAQLKSDITVKGPLFSEPVQIIVAKPLEKSMKIEGRGLRTGMSHQVILSPVQIELLEASPEGTPYDGGSMSFPARYRGNAPALCARLNSPPSCMNRIRLVTG